jgi:hypothetical protein
MLEETERESRRALLSNGWRLFRWSVGEEKGGCSN